MLFCRFPGEARCLGAEGGTVTYLSGRGPGILTPGEASQGASVLQMDI